jgi:TPR repeat protein
VFKPRTIPHEEYNAEARRLRALADAAGTRTVLLQIAATYDTLARQVRNLPKSSADVDNAMKCVGSLAFTAAMLVICGAVKGGDVEDGRNAEALLKADSSRAVSACRRLADQGDALAQFSLGFMYDNGQGVLQDYAEAAKWYRKAAGKTPRPSTTLARCIGAATAFSATTMRACGGSVGPPIRAMPGLSTISPSCTKPGGA